MFFYELHVFALSNSKVKCSPHSCLFAGVCKACGSRDAAGAGKLAHFQQQFARDLDPTLPGAPQTLGDMTDRLKVDLWLLPIGQELKEMHAAFARLALYH